MTSFIQNPVVKISTVAAVASLTGYLTQIAPPLGCAVYCATGGLVFETLTAPIGKDCIKQNSTVLRAVISLTAKIFAFIASVAAARKMVQLTTGFNMTTAIDLKLSVAIILVIGGALVLGVGLVGLVNLKKTSFPSDAAGAEAPV